MRLRHATVAAALPSAFLGAAYAETAEQGFVSMLNGKDLTGWEGKPRGMVGRGVVSARLLGYACTWMSRLRFILPIFPLLPQKRSQELFLDQGSNTQPVRSASGISRNRSSIQGHIGVSSRRLFFCRLAGKDSTGSRPLAHTGRIAWGLSHAMFSTIESRRRYLAM